jgi:hypothetical protein
MNNDDEGIYIDLLNTMKTVNNLRKLIKRIVKNPKPGLSENFYIKDHKDYWSCFD